jgi:putative phage-type endonuclease
MDQINMDQAMLYEISDNDKREIYTLVCELIDNYMNDFLITMKNPGFHNNLNDFMLNELQTIYEDVYCEMLEEECMVIIQKVCRHYFSNVMPRRSYKTSFAKPRVHINKLSVSIDRLRNVPQHEQRTPEWYIDRWNMISASSAWKALSSDSYKNSIIYEKCTPIDTSKYAHINVDSPFHWGQKYEPLSIQIYEDKYSTKVEDFGCIPHPDFPNIGASPDGINTDPKSSRYGRMVEVKNRFSESVPITGIPKEEYWIQMQLQMNVCDLNECDFLETRFKQYNTYDDFYKDGDTFQNTTDGKMKGIYLCFEKNGMPHYEYPDLHITKDEFDMWETKTIKLKAEEGYEWISYIYWYLDKMSCVLVFRNKQWFNLALIELNTVWDTIIKERETGYEHRSPNKRVKKVHDPAKSKCLIDISILKI